MSLPRNAWNVCLTHDPKFAGLYRAVEDFSRGLDAPVLSFDDGREDRALLTARDHAHRIPAGSDWLSRDGHVLSTSARRRAEALTHDAALLVVHSMFRSHALWARDWAIRTRRPYWAVPHGCLDPWGLARRAWVKRAWLLMGGRRYLCDADCVIFSTQRELKKASPWTADCRGVVVNWPVALPSLADRARARARFREALGIPAEDSILLSVGRLHSMKRPQAMIAAFAEARAQACHLVLVGMDGDLTATDVKAAVPAEARDRVHVTGGLAGPDLADAYLAADGFISLSHRENFGYAFAEALAFGLPVIVSPGHDLAHEMPRHADGGLACGWLLPDDRLDSATAAIREWATLAAGSDRERSQLESLGIAGRQWAADQLAFDRFRDRLNQLVGR